MMQLLGVAVLGLWIAVATRMFWIRRFGEPSRAKVAAFLASVAFLLGLLWPFPPRLNFWQPEPASNRVVPGRDTAALCAGLKPPYTESNYGSLDAIDADPFSTASEQIVPEGRTLQRGTTYAAVGWAASGDDKVPARGVCVILDGHPVKGGSVTYGLERPDVARYFNNDALVDTGFRAEIPGTKLTPGQHELRIVAMTPDRGAALLPPKRTLLIK